MTTRRVSQLLVLLAALFGVLAFVCAGCASRRFLVHGSSFPVDYPNGPSIEAWMRENGVVFSLPGSHYPDEDTVVAGGNDPGEVPGHPGSMRRATTEPEEETEFPKLSEP